MKTVIRNVERDAERLSESVVDEIKLSIDRKRDHLVVTEVRLVYKAGLLMRRKNIVVARYKLRPVRLLEREGK